MINLTNLAILRDYLVANQAELEEHFDMSCWVKHSSGSRNTPIARVRGGVTTATACGTVACVLGHAALSGIPELAVPEEIDDWDDYCYEVFGCYPQYFPHDKTGSYIFNCRWTSVDNTLKGAIHRLSAVIDNNGVVPELTEFGW